MGTAFFKIGVIQGARGDMLNQRERLATVSADFG
jgi:hypothetical protein